MQTHKLWVELRDKSVLHVHFFIDISVHKGSHARTAIEDFVTERPFASKKLSIGTLIEELQKLVLEQN